MQQPQCIDQAVQDTWKWSGRIFWKPEKTDAKIYFSTHPLTLILIWVAGGQIIVHTLVCKTQKQTN